MKYCSISLIEQRTKAGDFSPRIVFLVSQRSFWMALKVAIQKETSLHRTITFWNKRGEYVVLSASSKNSSSTAGPMGMVTQVPTKTYAGLYIFKSVYGHYVVGPTNVLQDSKEDRGCDVDNVADLKNHIFTFFPRYVISYLHLVSKKVQKIFALK